MKKILIVLYLFILIGAAQIQGQGVEVIPHPTESAAGYVSQYQTYYDALAVKPSAAVAAAQNTFIQTLVSAGTWAKIDVLYIFAQVDGSDALINVISPGTFDCTNVHATSFTTLEGFTGDGANDYINTNWNPIDDRVNYQINDASFGIYVRGNTQDDGFTIGVESSTGSRILFRARSSSNATSYWINASGSGAYSSNTDGSGLWIIQRTASNAIALYQDNTERNTDIDASAALSSRDVILLARDDEGSFSSYAANQISMFFTASSLTSGDRTAITNGFATYMTSNGK